MSLQLNNALLQIGNSKHTFRLLVTTSLQSSGLVCILGKSGCGKSTLLHILGLLQPIDKGSIKLDGADITKLKGREKEDYLNRTIAYVFQNYQLIEDQSIVFNVALPLMISGKSKHESFKRARELLESISFPKDKCNQLVNQCSGGEKQRVAILRAIINSPSIILADEPTGALDSKNSSLVMKLLKDYSSKALVLMVTHNEELAFEYADRIITMKDGSIVNDFTKNNFHNQTVKKAISNKKHRNSWISLFIEKNLKKRFRRNLVSGFGICFSLIFAFMLFGFSNGSSKVIEQETLKQYDLGVSTISNQKSEEIEGSKLSLVQQSRLTNQEIINFVSENLEYTYGLNYEAIVPKYMEVKFGNEIISDYSYNPIYSFGNDYCPNLLIKGKFPKDSLTEVLVNNKLENDYTKTFKESILGKELSLFYGKEITNYFDDELNPYIVDYFSYELKVQVVGVVEEIDFLNTPKIYYSYKALDKYLDTYVMSNLSSYLGETITFKDKIDQALPNDELSSYSYILFLENYENYQLLSNKYGDYVIDNGALVIKQALESFISATTMGMEIFLIITSLGSILILGITSFSSYSQDKHINAILMSLGANKDSISEIYLMESLLIGLISFLFSIIISVVSSPVLNKLIFTFTNFDNMIQIPFNSYMNYKFLLPVIVFGATILTSFLSAYLPISFAGKINISKELKEE